MPLLGHFQAAPSCKASISPRGAVRRHVGILTSRSDRTPGRWLVGHDRAGFTAGTGAPSKRVEDSVRNRVYSE